jgi:hypothetical protein
MYIKIIILYFKTFIVQANECWQQKDRVLQPCHQYRILQGYKVDSQLRSNPHFIPTFPDCRTLRKQRNSVSLATTVYFMVPLFCFTTLGITCGIMTLSIMGLFVTLDINNTQQGNAAITLSVVMLSVAFNLLLC